MLRLVGRQAVVVGAGAGFGHASAKRLAVEGADLLLVDGDECVLEGLAEMLRQQGRVVGTAVADTSDFEALAEAASGSGLTRVDALVTFHGAMAWGTLADLEMSEYEAVVRFNLVGPVAATKAFLPLLKASAAASVIHVGSVDGMYGNPIAVGYSASKAGLIPLTHIMARELAPHNIRVNTVATAQTNQVMATDFDQGDYPDAAAGMPLQTHLELREGSPVARPQVPSTSTAQFPGAAYLEKLSRATPLKRVGPPTEWAGTVAFLASDDSSYVTGSVIVVDCGRTGLTPGTYPWDSPSTV